MSDFPAHRDFLKQAMFSDNRRLLPHQVEQAIFAFERKHSINASETGTGKYLIALAVRRLIEREAGRIILCLYTCPKSALGQFEKEFTDNGYKPFVLRRGVDLIPADADTVLVANSTLLVTHRDQLRSWRPRLVVLDEAAAFKNARAARTKAVYGDNLDGAGGVIDGAQFAMAMSGTLAPAHNGELFPHLRALAPAALLDDRGRTMLRYVFEAKFCEHAARRVAGGREVSTIVGSATGPCCANVPLPTSPASPCATSPRRCRRSGTELVPIAREDVNLDEVAAIADIEDTDIRVAVQVLAAAIAGGLVSGRALSVRRRD